MTDYQKYINALRKCAKEHENDTTYTGHIVVSALCKDTANLLETLEQEPTTKNCESCKYYGSLHEVCNYCYKCSLWTYPYPKMGHWELVQRGKLIDVCCSNCGAVRIKEYAYNYTIDQLKKEDLKECFECADMRYCPNCGAKMVEPQESEDTK